MGLDALEASVAQKELDKTGVTVVIERPPDRYCFRPETPIRKADDQGAPGRNTRATSRTTATGCCRYCTDTQTIAASMLASASGSLVTRLRFWTNQRLSRGLAASSAAFMPWPITSA